MSLHCACSKVEVRQLTRNDGDKDVLVYPAEYYKLVDDLLNGGMDRPRGQHVTDRFNKVFDIFLEKNYDLLVKHKGWIPLY